MTWQVPPVCRRRSIRSLSAGVRSMSPPAIAALMRGKSCSTRRPAPMLRCPTSELPICPDGRPTSSPDVCKKACGQVAHKWSKLGVRAWRMALSAASSRQPQPSSTTSITGRRFCISTFPRSPCLTGGAEIAIARNDGASSGCVGLRHHRQPARPLAADRWRCETVLFVSHRRDFCSAPWSIPWTAINSTPRSDKLPLNRCHFRSGG